MPKGPCRLWVWMQRIPRLQTSPNIGKTAKDFFKHANEPDIKVIETPDTAQVLTGYTITREAGAAKVRPRVEIIEAKEIPAGELEAFKSMDPRTSRTLSSKYKKSTIRDGMTTLDEGTQEVQLYRATGLKGRSPSWIREMMSSLQAYPMIGQSMSPCQRQRERVGLLILSSSLNPGRLSRSLNQSLQRILSGRQVLKDHAPPAISGPDQ